MHPSVAEQVALQHRRELMEDAAGRHRRRVAEPGPTDRHARRRRWPKLWRRGAPAAIIVPFGRARSATASRAGRPPPVPSPGSFERLPGLGIRSAPE